jgi:hypothetical protein
MIVIRPLIVNWCLVKMMSQLRPIKKQKLATSTHHLGIQINGFEVINNGS